MIVQLDEGALRSVQPGTGDRREPERVAKYLVMELDNAAERVCDRGDVRTLIVAVRYRDEVAVCVGDPGRIEISPTVTTL